MKNSYIKFSVVTLLSFAILSCISPFEPKGASVEGLLVVEGDIILNDTTVITLSRSSSLSSCLNKSLYNSTLSDVIPAPSHFHEHPLIHSDISV